MATSFEFNHLQTWHEECLVDIERNGALPINPLERMLDMKKTLIAAALTALAAAGQANAAAFTALPIMVDPDGAAGGSGAIQITSLNWLAGNTLTVGALGLQGEAATNLANTAGRNLTTWYQAALNTFVFNSGGGSTATLPVAGSEWTVVARIEETAFNIGTGSAAFVPFAGSVSVFYHGAKNANDISGTGYGDGVEILRGTIVAGNGTFLDFTRLAGPTTAPATGLDGFGDNNAPGVGTHTGSGQSTIKVDIGATAGDFIDPNFFLTDITSLNFLLSTIEDVNDTGQLVTPFTQANPSDLVGGVAPSYSPGDATFTNGINGADCAVGNDGNFTQRCDFHFQTTNVTSFTYQQQVPTPGTLALAGLGLSLLGMAGRRRKQS